MKIIAIGTFDGVHIAHQELIKRATDVLAIETGCEVITPTAEKKRIIEEMGCKFISVPLDEVREMSPKEFFDAYLSDADSIVCGYNFTFGKGKSGDVQTLRELVEVGRPQGLPIRTNLQILEEIRLDGQEVSTSGIKKLIKNGDKNRAERLLGRILSNENWKKLEKNLDKMNSL